jgi:hypothetical protein
MVFNEGIPTQFQSEVKQCQRNGMILTIKLSCIFSPMIINHIRLKMLILLNTGLTFSQFHRCCRGSPADRYALGALRWIVRVNGKPTPDLDAFVNVTKVWPLIYVIYVWSCFL